MDSNLSTFLKSYPALRAVTYCRVSSKEQQEGFSLEMQSKLIEKFANENGIAVLNRFEEAASASKTKRPEYQRMLKFLEGNRASRPEQPIVVLVEKSDRFGRNMFDFADFLRAGFKAIEVKTGSMISPGQSSWEMKRMWTEAVDNQSYSQKLSEEVRKGQLGKALEGYFPFGLKFSYESFKDCFGKNTMVPDPLRAPLVGQLFKDFATGEYSVKTLAKRYRELGLTIKKSGRPLTYQQLHKILRDKAYAGYFICAGTEFKATKYEPLVSIGLWQQVQEVLNNRSRTKKATVSKHEFAYARLMSCKDCGCLVCGDSKKNGRYIYYRCANGRQVHNSQNKAPYIEQRFIEEAIEQFLNRLNFTPEMIALMYLAHKSRYAEKDKVKTMSIESIERQLAVIKAQRITLAGKLGKGVIGDDVYADTDKELKSRIQELTLSLNTQKSFKPADDGNGKHLHQIIKTLPIRFSLQTPLKKRRFLATLFQSVKMDGKGLEIELKLPFKGLFPRGIYIEFKRQESKEVA